MAKKSLRRLGNTPVGSDINYEILDAILTTNNRLMDVLERVVLGPQKADLVRAVDQTIAHYAFGEATDGGVGSDPSVDGSLAPSWENDPEMVDSDNGDGNMRGLSVVDIGNEEEVM